MKVCLSSEEKKNFARNFGSASVAKAKAGLRELCVVGVYGDLFEEIVALPSSQPGKHRNAVLRVLHELLAATGNNAAVELATDWLRAANGADIENPGGFFQAKAQEYLRHVVKTKR